MNSTTIFHPATGYKAKVRPMGGNSLSNRTIKRHMKKCGDMNIANYVITEPTGVTPRNWLSLDSYFRS